MVKIVVLTYKQCDRYFIIIILYDRYLLKKSLNGGEKEQSLIFCPTRHWYWNSTWYLISTEYYTNTIYTTNIWTQGCCLNLNKCYNLYFFRKQHKMETDTLSNMKHFHNNCNVSGKHNVGIKWYFFSSTVMIKYF